MDILSSNSPQDNPDDLYAEMMRLAAERAKSLPPNPAYDRVAHKLQSGARSMCAKCGMHPRLKSGSHSTWCRQCHNEYARENAKKNYTPEKGRKSNLRRMYRLTQEEYDLMLFRQGGVCAICGAPETVIHPKTGRVQSLAVDHNHATGDVRELLCHSCNTLVMLVEQDRERMNTIRKYLKKHDR